MLQNVFYNFDQIQGVSVQWFQIFRRDRVHLDFRNHTAVHGRKRFSGTVVTTQNQRKERLNRGRKHAYYS